LFLIDYVEDIYQTMVDAIGSKKLEDAIDELKEQTPSPMNTMLNKQSREEAIQKRNTRDRMQLVDVPPTNPGILKLVIIQLDLKSVNNAMTVDHPKFVTFYYFSSYCCSWQPGQSSS
jgi:FtsZ-binding cell division protein ZapB